MMSFSPIKSAGGAAGYYSDKDNYYVLGSLESHWIGRGAESLGLEGHVDNLALTDILRGKLPDGSSLSRIQNGREIHRPGYDLTFSAPKSVSVMALIGGDKRFIDAHNHAVSVAMSEVEGLASARVTHDKITCTRLTGNLVAALFNHDTSRDLDPQLHTHALVINATRTDNGWRALASDTKGKTGFSETVMANQVALGNIYRVALRSAVEAFGFSTHVSGKNGLWELDEIPVEVFSRRSEAINAAAGSDASLKSRDVATLDTRKSKVACDPAALVSEWKERLEKTGFNMCAYQEKAAYKAVKAEFTGSRGARTGKADKASGSHQSPAMVSRDLTIEEAVSKAVSLLSDRTVQFTYSDVLTKTVGQLPAEPGVFSAARAAIDAAIECQRLIPLDKEKGLFTSDIHLLNEMSVHAMAKDINANVRVAIFAQKSAERGAPYSDAMSVLAQDRAAIAIMSGTGDSVINCDRIAEVVIMAKELGREVSVLSADWRSDVWLNHDARLSGNTLNKSSLTAKFSLPPQSTLVIDQAEKLTLKETLLLLEQGRIQSTQLIFMDTEKRKGIGSALTVLSDAGVPRYVYRGLTPAEATIVSIADKRARFDQLAQAYARLDTEGVKVVAQVNGVKEQQLLTAAIRQQLQQQGRMGDDNTVSTLIPVWLDNKSRHQRDSYRPGMVMERWDSEKKVMNRYTIDRVTDISNTVSLKNAEGETHTEKVSRLDSRWSLYRHQKLKVATGDRLRALGREAEGKLKARDELTVLSVSADEIVVLLSGKTLTLSSREPLKLSHSFVESLGSSVTNGQTVLAATSPKDMSQAGLSQLSRSGEKIIIFTAMAADKASARLETNPHYRLASEQVKRIAGEEALDVAIQIQKDNLYSEVEKAVRLAVGAAQQKSHNGITFTATQLLNASLSISTTLGIDVLKAEITRQIKRGDLLSLDAVTGMGAGLIIPRPSYDMEKSILRNIAEGKNAVAPLMDAVVEKHLSGLTPGQQNATRLILESSDRFIAIQGYAGVGKTTQLRAVMVALATLPDKARPEVIGIGPTHRAVHEMQSVGVNAQTLASFLSEERQLIHDGGVSRHAGKLFLLDESSMMGNRDMAEAYRLIARAGARAVSSGDSAQLSAIDSGAPFTLQQQRSAADVAIMKDIVRQTPALKPAVYSMITGNYRQALDHIVAVTPAAIPRRQGAWVPGSSVMEFKQHRKSGEPDNADLTDKCLERVPGNVLEAVIADYAGRQTQAREDTLVIVKLNEDRRYINAMIHDELKKNGELGNRERSFEVLTQVPTQRDEMRSAAAWSGFTGKLAFLDNTFYSISHVDPSKGMVTLRDGEGVERILSSLENSTRDASVWERKKIMLSPGDKVRFSATDNERGYVANSTWKVTDMDQLGNLWLSCGELLKQLNPGANLYESRIDLAYAVTAHGAQGASEKYGITLEATEGARKQMVSRESSYVALSRGKEHIQIYTDDMKIWISQLETSTARLTAHDIMYSDSDKSVKVASQLLRWAKPMAETGLGRSLLHREGITGEFRGSLIASGAKYPAPHMALPLYDSNGRQSGALLDELISDDTGVLFRGNPKIVGSKDARFAALQQSQNGNVWIASGLTEGMNIARDNPQTGVLVRLCGEGKPWNIKNIIGGAASSEALPGTPDGTIKTDPLPVIKNSDPLGKFELDIQQEKAARKVSEALRNTELQVARIEVKPAAEKERSLCIPAREADNVQNAVHHVAAENIILNRIQQNECDRVNEKTLEE